VIASPQRRAKLRTLRRALARFGGTDPDARGEWCAVGVRPGELPAEGRAWRGAGDPARIEAADGELEGLVLADALEHVGDETVLLAEARRAIRPLGVLVVTVPRLSRGPAWLLRRALGLPPAFYGHRHEGYSHPGLRLLLEGAGFKVVERATFGRFFAATATALADRILGSRSGGAANSPLPVRLLAGALDVCCRLLDALLLLLPGHGLLLVARRKP